MEERKNYDYITENEKQELIEIFAEKIKSSAQRNEKGLWEAQLVLQMQEFEIELPDDELEQIASLTIEIIEELKKINNNGLGRKQLDKLKEDVLTEHPEYRDNGIYHIFVYSKFKTERMSEINRELNNICCVGGAYALLMVNPAFQSAIYAVFDKLVDSFDDEELYLSSVYFLYRAALKMSEVTKGTE